MNQLRKTPPPPVALGPNAAARRLLVTVLEHVFEDGWRTPDDFLRHFPAGVLLEALKGATDLRVALLSAATGLHEEILRRKTPALAAQDLHMALEEGMTNSRAILEVFSAEDRVRYLNPREVWRFVAADEFWVQEPTASAELTDSCASRMAVTLGAALTERLITQRDILDALTYEGVANYLSPKDLREVVTHALTKGREGVGLSDRVFFEVVPLEKLCRAVPLEVLWSQVVERRIAVPNGLVTAPTGAADNAPVPPSARAKVPPPPSSRMAASRAETGREAPPSTPQRTHSALPPPIPPRWGGAQPAASSWDGDDQAPTAVPPSVTGVTNSLFPPDRAAFDSPAASPLGTMDSGSPELPSGGLSVDPSDVQEQRKRQRVVDHLASIGRLPPNHATLPTAILGSIDGMYALLPGAADDVQRRSVIRQSFANENYLRAALLGLIALMDSSIDTSDRVIQDAKIDALIKILLFEEQRRKEAGRSLAVQASHGAPSGSVQSVWPDPLGEEPAVPPSSQFPHAPAESLSGQGVARPSHPPLPNLPADSPRGAGRSIPPPLPVGYQGNHK